MRINSNPPGSGYFVVETDADGRQALRDDRRYVSFFTCLRAAARFGSNCRPRYWDGQAWAVDQETKQGLEP